MIFEVKQSLAVQYFNRDEVEGYTLKVSFDSLLFACVK